MILNEYGLRIQLIDVGIAMELQYLYLFLVLWLLVLLHIPGIK